MRQRTPSPSPAFRPGFVPPSPLAERDWRLGPLHPDLGEVDHAAWSSCRERLVRELDWNGWPAPGFSLQDNEVDLAEHFREFEANEAYAYSVLSGPRCVGCVYLEPWTEGAQLAFWVVDDWLEREAEVVLAVLGWLEDWPIDVVVLPVRAHNHRARALLEGAGLKPAPGPAGHVSYVP